VGIMIQKYFETIRGKGGELTLNENTRRNSPGKKMGGKKEANKLGNAEVRIKQNKYHHHAHHNI